MKDIMKNLGVLIFFVIVAMLAIKAVEWVVPSPPYKYYICVEDYNGKHDCVDQMKEN